MPLARRISENGRHYSSLRASLSCAWVLKHTYGDGSGTPNQSRFCRARSIGNIARLEKTGSLALVVLVRNPQKDVHPSVLVALG
jgi:hypothetical protein